MSVHWRVNKSVHVTIKQGERERVRGGAGGEAFPFTDTVNRSDYTVVSILVAAPSKAWLFCYSLTGIAGSNLAGSMDVPLL